LTEKAEGGEAMPADRNMEPCSAAVRTFSRREENVNQASRGIGLKYNSWLSRSNMERKMALAIIDRMKKSRITFAVLDQITAAGCAPDQSGR
jgi:hypothetical protein